MENVQKHIDISGAFKFGWAKFKENWKFLIITVAILYLLTGCLRALVGASFKDVHPTRDVLDFLINGVVLWIYFNAIRAILGIVDSRPPKVADLFNYDKSFWSYVVASILYGILVAVGFILFIIPGIYFTLRFGMYVYAIADKKVGPIEAFKESSRLTYGVRWQILLFDLVAMAVVFAGVIALVVGVFVAVPVIALATVYIYRELTNQTKEPIPVDVVTPAPAEAPEVTAAPAAPVEPTPTV